MPENKDEPNPYQQGRDHESNAPMDREDVLAVAGLLGTVNGALSEIDKRNIGGVQARQMDPKSALQKIASANGAVINPPGGHTPPPPVPSSTPPPVVGNVASPVLNVSPTGYTAELEKRILALESIVGSYKKVEKFKRGIGYSIQSAKIKGTFKDPTTILDLISTELSKNTKTIKLTLIDATTESKK